MSFTGKPKPRPVNKDGARADCVLRGCGLNNQGLRLRVSQEQARGQDGAIKGRFLILDVGDNMHSEALQPFLHQATDAQAVLGAVRRLHAACVSVVNANILVVEQP